MISWNCPNWSIRSLFYFQKKTKTKNITLALRYVIPYVIPCANNLLKVMRGDSHKELRQPENSLQCNLSLLVVKAVYACAPSPKSDDGPAMFCVCTGKLEGLDREKSRSDCFAHRREQQECFSSVQNALFFFFLLHLQAVRWIWLRETIRCVFCFLE